MALNSILKIFLPKDRVFFDLFENVATNVALIALKLKEMVSETDFDKRATILVQIEDLEHVNDDYTHRIFTELGRNFITPFDREDIHYLATALDDICDYIYASAKKINFYKVNPDDVGFQKMAEYMADLFIIKNPLVRLHKMGEYYIKFGLENPAFYDLMFILQAPMEALAGMVNCEWKSGEGILDRLKDTLQECMDKNLIVKGDVDAMAMSIWGMVHGMVSLSIRNRFEKVVTHDQIAPMMTKGLTWFLNVLDASGNKE